MNTSISLSLVSSPLLTEPNMPIESIPKRYRISGRCASSFAKTSSLMLV
ncbi:MAG: hypothetical protein PHV39_01315 [Methanomicrobium sp.]|nr:hypothetical protein [Methanomicrobium sp.]